jgi:hypothetical protein
MEVIPLSAFPLTRVSTSSATEIPSATPLTTLEKIVELEKSMEEMNLQETEINRLKKEVENLHELKSSYQANYSKEKKYQTSSDRNYNSLKRRQWQTKHFLRSRNMSGWTSPNLLMKYGL